MDFDTNLFPQISSGLLLISVFVLLVARSPRGIIMGLVVLYVGVFGLVVEVWPQEQAVVKLVAGWMSAAILGATLLRLPDETQGETARPASSLFRLMIGGIVFLLAVSVAEDLGAWFPSLKVYHAFGGILLSGMGIFMIGFSEKPVPLSLALLVLFAGFEVIYAVLEDSALVAALLALLNIAVVLTGSYLHLSGTMRAGEDLG